MGYSKNPGGPEEIYAIQKRTFPKEVERKTGREEKGRRGQKSRKEKNDHGR
jgi:hypothetical protein